MRDRYRKCPLKGLVFHYLFLRIMDIFVVGFLPIKKRDYV